MINKLKNYSLVLVFFLISILVCKNSQFAAEILIYGDNISYDKEENLIAKGKAKAIYRNKIITSNLIIYSKKEQKIILPLEFNLKDERNNLYYGTSGFFSKNLSFGSINEPRLLLEDGSRIVGKTAKRIENIDIITKGVYSPCYSKIKIANFLCPIWQLEGEKILHDYDKLFLYQKHAKMRVLNIPVLYSPYLVTPSPLRKKRKSGFLNPTISFNFLDSKTSQSTSLPYYFNIAIDKELTFTPTLNYGGGADSSQRFNFDYNHLISGGLFESVLTFDTTIENSNREKWLKKGSIENYYYKNLNENFNLTISSALQTTKNYIQLTTPNNDLSYSSSLTTRVGINGYNINKIDDRLKINLSTYQSLQNKEENNTIPKILPFITFNTGQFKSKYFDYDNTIEFYNIFRDNNTAIHSKSQRKISGTLSINKDVIKYGTLFTARTNLYNQFYDVEDKKVDAEYYSNQYFRSFPIFGIDLETPFKFKPNFQKLIYTPKASLIISPGISNTNKISNEDSSVNSYTIQNNGDLNRYTGTDKLDNSKRINLSFQIHNEEFKTAIWQSYEFTNNSNFHYSQGNEKKLSDLLGYAELDKESYSTSYNFRYDPHNNFVKSHNLDTNFSSKFGDLNLKYLDQRSKVNETIVSDKETINYSFSSAKIYKYSKISYSGLYDVNLEINKENSFAYSYFDECFGVNLNFGRNSYTKNELKPQDMLTIMFSFKNVGSYRSTNLAVSETDKQDIKWESYGVKNELFD